MNWESLQSILSAPCVSEILWVGVCRSNVMASSSNVFYAISDEDNKLLLIVASVNVTFRDEYWTTYTRLLLETWCFSNL